ncbi:MFS transporter [Marinobacter sp. JSM 1782161]|uniref:MFS transporter n=1 Tax=Marinobacter sp. JSM 1782161 TaxID=2685906 RepID=UPI001401E8F4|nr:MFS transporter [Marinobacter sp. JSM 1782161]
MPALQDPPVRHSRLLIWLAIFLIGLNLRPIMAAIGPVLDTLKLNVGLTDVGAGFLTTLPVFAMGLVALFGGVLQRWISPWKGVGLAVLVIALASLVRGFGHSNEWLILTAAVGGVGIAVVQALMPAYIKNRLGERAGQGMALFTTGIMAGSAVAAGTAAPFAEWLGWPFALSVWSALGLIAAVVWRRSTRHLAPSPAPQRFALPVRSRRAWFLLLFFGIGTSAYTLVLAWLPPFYTQLGHSPAFSGLLLGVLTLIEVGAGLSLSVVLPRFPDRRQLLFTVLALGVAGFLALIVAPNALVWPAIVALGLSIGTMFPLALIVTMEHLDDERAAGALMGFVQGGGYILASLMPLVAGMIRQETADLTNAWLIMLVGTGVQMAMVPFILPGDRLVPGSWRLARAGA